MTERCSVRVYGRFSFSGTQCTKAGKVQENGRWFCGTHCSDAKKARAEKQRARWDADTKLSRERQAKQREMARRAECFDGLVEALRCLIENQTAEAIKAAKETLSAALEEKNQEP
jgi:hypothetical protein